MAIVTDMVTQVQPTKHILQLKLQVLDIQDTIITQQVHTINTLKDHTTHIIITDQQLTLTT